MKYRKSRRPRRDVTGVNAPVSGKLQLSGEHAPAAGGRADRRFQGLLIGLVLCVLTLLVYSNSFRAGIVLDNKGLLLQDPRIRAATGANVALILEHTYWWPLGEAGIYRPLTTLSYLFNYAILGDGDQAAGYHWVNLGLHMANVLLVFAVGRRLLGQLGPSALLAALWAVHPASTESVTNIIGRSDLLAAMATLGGFLMYVKSAQTAGPRRIAWLAGLGMATAVGVFSKESAVTIVGVIALYEMARPERRRWSDLLSAFVATGIPIAAMLLQRASVLAGSPPAEFPFTDNPIAGAVFWTGRLTALKVTAHYLAQTVWPWRLSIDYSYSQIPLVSGSAEDWVLVVVTLLAAAGLVGLWRWNRTAFFLAGFALIVFLPTSNLLFPIGTIRADRLLYLPAVGLLGCVVMAVYALGSRMRSPLVAPVILLVMTAGFALRTWARNAEWCDELTLASADVRTSPRSFKLHGLMATTMFAADPSHANIGRVVEEIDKSLAILDPLPDLRNASGTYHFAGAAYLAKGDRLQTAGAGDAEMAYRRSLELLKRCIQIDKAYEQQREARYGKLAPGVVARTEPEAYRLLSIVHQRLGDMDGALEAAHEAQRMAPQDPRMYIGIADLLLRRHQGEDAAVVLTEGMLITSDQGLRSDLVRLYGSSTDPANCTLVPHPNGPAINLRCQIVLDHMCAAAPHVLMALIDMGRRQKAMQQKQAFISECQCPPGPLNEVLP
jgi:tetratricopeptide (TPR) repeat protein